MYDDMIQALGRAPSTSSEQDNPLIAVTFRFDQLFLDIVFLSIRISFTVTINLCSGSPD